MNPPPVLNSPKESSYAVKIMFKQKLQEQINGVSNLLKEIKVHWVLQECDGILRLIELFEDRLFVYLVLEY